MRRASVRRAVRLVVFALALVGSLGSGACRDVAAPLPVSAVRFTPPPVYARWWAITEGCSGRTGDFAAYSWYVVPGHSVPDGRVRNVAAYADVVGRRMVFAASWRDDGGTVRHEMLHALLGPAYASGDLAHQHPPAYFQGRCAGVVDCPEIGCGDAGPAPVTAPANAPTLPLSAVDIRVDLLSNPVSRTGADNFVSLIVRVTNPSTGPVWVPLEATPDLRPPYVHWYGFRIVPAGQRVPIADLTRTDSAGMVTSDSIRRVPFAARQTREWVIDMPASVYPAGDYLAVGFFNTRQVWTPLTVTP